MLRPRLLWWTYCDVDVCSREQRLEESAGILRRRLLLARGGTTRIGRVKLGVLLLLLLL